jgi:hypothetical protein
MRALFECVVAFFLVQTKFRVDNHPFAITFLDSCTNAFRLSARGATE